MKLEHVVYENISDKFDIGHCRTKVFVYEFNRNKNAELYLPSIEFEARETSEKRDSLYKIICKSMFLLIYW